MYVHTHLLWIQWKRCFPEYTLYATDTQLSVPYTYSVYSRLFTKLPNYSLNSLPFWYFPALLLPPNNQWFAHLPRARPADTAHTTVKPRNHIFNGCVLWERLWLCFVCSAASSHTNTTDLKILKEQTRKLGQLALVGFNYQNEGLFRCSPVNSVSSWSESMLNQWEVTMIWTQ